MASFDGNTKVTYSLMMMENHKEHQLENNMEAAGTLQVGSFYNETLQPSDPHQLEEWCGRTMGDNALKPKPIT